MGDLILIILAAGFIAFILRKMAQEQAAAKCKSCCDTGLIEYGWPALPIVCNDCNTYKGPTVRADVEPY